MSNDTICAMATASGGAYNISKEEKLIDYHPKYTNVDCIKIVVRSYVDRNIVSAD